MAALLAWLPRSDAVITILVLIGLIGGHPAGPIMSLAARVLAPETRAIGMGVFYTLFYAAMMLGPAVAGRLAKSAGTAAVALDLGALTVLACPPLMWLFERIVSVLPRDRTRSCNRPNAALTLCTLGSSRTPPGGGSGCENGVGATKNFFRPPRNVGVSSG